MSTKNIRNENGKNYLFNLNQQENRHETLLCSQSWPGRRMADQPAPETRSYISLN